MIRAGRSYFIEEGPYTRESTEAPKIYYYNQMKPPLFPLNVVGPFVRVYRKVLKMTTLK